MTVKRISKKFLKITGFITGGFLLLLTAFHFWFVYHAEKIIQDLVLNKSNGKIRLEVENFKFNWFSKKMELEKAVFYTTDSMTAGTSYRFNVKQIKLKVRAVYPILFEDVVLINNLSLKDPDIVVTRLRRSRDSTRGDRSSIPQEMGRIYKSIQDALSVLEVKKFEIENARFTLINKIQPDQLPVTIGRIDFHIDNLSIDTGKLTGKEKIFFSDNVVFKSRDQAITFPDGRHKLSYRKFRINIEKKIVEIDSCTIAAVRTDSSSSDFSIFFDELVMTNIDFDTLYRNEVIKADSVYCTSPQFKLHINFDKRTGARKSRPKLDEIIRQLTGDLLLNFVVVNNASFDINTLRNGNPNSFTSDKNNFEIQGLRVDNDAERPLKVKKFALAIRNYENFLRDSTYEMQFDSIHFNDDKIRLSDFKFRKVVGGKTINQLNVPQFQMTGMSWDDLLFEQKLKAQHATLYNPDILFTENPKNGRRNKNRNIFDALASINELVMLEDLNIINGDIALRLNGGIRLDLDDATLSVQSRSLLGSSRLSGIRRSVNYLDFQKGALNINDLSLKLEDIRFTGGDSRLQAGFAEIRKPSASLFGLLRNVTMDEILIDEYTGDVSIGAIGWEQGNFSMNTPASRQNGGSHISLHDIHGKNTDLSLLAGNKKISARLDHIEAIAILVKPGERPLVGGLQLQGKDLSVSDPVSQLSISSFSFKDLEKADLVQLRYHKAVSGDTTAVTVPRLTFTPDLQQAISGHLRAGEIEIVQPVIRLIMEGKNRVADGAGRVFPATSVDKLVILQPDLYFSLKNDQGTHTLRWDGEKKDNSQVALHELRVSDTSFRVKQASLTLNHFLYTDAHGKKFDAGQGELAADLRDFSMGLAGAANRDWEANLNSLEGRDFVFDSLGKKAGRLHIATVQLKDLALRSATFTHPRQLISENKNFLLDHITGSYTDADNRFHWFNAGYDKSRKSLALDSFSYSPTPPKDEFVASRAFQTDYLQIKTGAIRIGPFDIDSYLQDTIFRVGRIAIDDVLLNDFRDRRPPFKTGIIKPLMVNRIKSIPVKIMADTLVFNNANITYAELNPKTNQTGIILFNRTVLKFFPVRNFGFRETDSLRIHANGYLMDSVWVRLRLKESYTDSLSGFLLTLRMKPADMRVLNPVLMPLASAKLRSGRLDTLSMRVAGGEYLAFGEMKMRYHDLNIQLYRDSVARKKGLLTLIANAFVIRNQNKDRTSSVFYIRNRERSPINYLIKILMSGVNSSIGVKSNRKIMRQYKKELQERNLPPVDYD